MKVALVTCSRPPQEDFDAPPLVRALAARGHAAAPAAWDDPAVDWPSFDAALLRSTWDYYHRRDAFLEWAARTATVTALWNPLDVVHWSTHKFYLRDLESRGVDIVPTVFLPAGSRSDVAGLLAQRGWDMAVLKPAVSADSFATLRFEKRAPAPGQAHLDDHLHERDMLVQQYLPTVVEPGERCLVFIDGTYSHAVRKRSLFLGGRHAGPEGVAVPASEDELAAARRALERTGWGPLLYARVDLLRDARGTPRLMELELVEPSLFFAAGPGSAARLVEALERRMRSGAAPERMP
jgi:hypothetical protein